MRKVLPVIALLFFGIARADSPSASEFTEAGHTADSIDIVKSRVESGKAVLIDVREPGEWEDGHLKMAKLVPMSVVKSETLTKEMKANLPKDKPIYCHCRSGGRVLTVSKLLRAKGYDIRPLQDGYEKLLDADFEKAAVKEDR